MSRFLVSTKLLQDQTLTSTSILGSIFSGLNIISKLPKNTSIVSNVANFSNSISIVNEIPSTLLTSGVPILKSSSTITFLGKASLIPYSSIRNVALNDSMRIHKELVGNSRNKIAKILQTTDQPLTMPLPTLFKSTAQVKKYKDDKTDNLILHKKI